MIQLLIVADDYTGALDTGVQFAKQGIPTLVASDYLKLNPAELTDFTVLAVDSDSRADTPSQAAAKTRALMQWARRNRITAVYKKFDSALRGQIGAELAAVLSETDQRFIPLVPAYPANGRATRNGIQYIHDVPVAQSIFGKDPFNPVTESAVADIIHQQSALPVMLSGRDPEPDQPHVRVYDASSEADLAAVSKQIGADPTLRVLAGCAGFAAYLPEILSLPRAAQPALQFTGHFLILSGSLNDVSAAQIDCAAQAGVPVRTLTPEQALVTDYWQGDAGRADLAEMRRLLQTEDALILQSAASQKDFSAKDQLARQLGIPLDAVRNYVRSSFGSMTDALRSQVSISALGVIGGDTLRGIFESWPCLGLQPLAEIGAGTVASRIIGGPVDFILVSKSGGLGGPEAVLDMIRFLKALPSDN